jgi:hypothetical protein
MGGSRLDNVSDALDRSNGVLSNLVTRVTQLNTQLQVLESRSRLTDLSDTELRIPEIVSGVILVAGRASRNDPLAESVAHNRDSFSRLFAFIEVGDFSEGQAACDRVKAILEFKIATRLSAGACIVNLRWSPMIQPLEHGRTLVMGSRFRRDSNGRLSTLKERLTAEGFQVLEDEGEYGGGPLVYTLARNLSSNRALTVVELTLSSNVARQPKLVKKIMEALSKV